MAVYNKDDKLPQLVKDSLLMKSKEMPTGSKKVGGYDFNNGIDYRKLLESYAVSGFQATNFGRAVEEINKMLDKKAEPRVNIRDPSESPDRVYHPRERRDTNCIIFLGFTSNLISSGVRETVRFLVQHNLVDVLVTTAGGIEEDIIKCLGDTYVGDFNLRGRDLRSKGHNRIGNLVSPNENYIKFEKWMPKVLDQMLVEQNTQGVNWTPSKLIARLGREIDNPESVCYWAYKNDIPIFSPAITDGAIGDELYFQSYNNSGLKLDIVEDVRAMDNMAVFAAHSGMIILGGGLIKHHITNANLMRNGADYVVYINTAQEFDGSDAGARPDEAVSWGKIKVDANPVKIFSDFTLVFPLLVAETFARRVNLPLSEMNKKLQINNNEVNGCDHFDKKSDNVL